MIKELHELTLTELLALYGRTVWALADCDERDEPYRYLVNEQRRIEAEARRRDQATWPPAAKAVKREANGDVIFA